ncbi:hypothetical protein [Curtobacterium sp. MCBD17_040]|uniref:hypothetical protein n=1 Tax=Curtobacterium sp. MCBD17_040 TaxID=2175674 RepID=UPI000DA9EE36|nr:hypothetical protein [Curtobacterium sp. MCBD17_040]WIB65461.1 hypothetical protein DEI94_18995 [Curtobacterium sp. MCBD17_040]
MNPQLIYASYDPRAITWAHHAIYHGTAVNDAWTQFTADINQAFPTPDGPRGLALINNRIAGLRLATPGERIIGWDYAPGIDALVPNNSAEGRPWQKRFDTLPANEPPAQLSAVGMTDRATVTYPHGSVAVHFPHVYVPNEGGIVFALWAVREIKNAIDAQLNQLGTDTGIRWHEVPRSVWYARVEAEEAAAEAAADAG